jgi:NAD(P) transhydrogenase subunit beta
MSVVIQLAYLVASALFIIGLKRLSSPRTAVQGNRLAAVGMLIAIVATLLDQQIVGYVGIAIGALIGSAIGAVAAQRVQMTAMPQMVALFNGLGGSASALVAAAELLRLNAARDALRAGIADLSPDLARQLEAAVNTAAPVGAELTVPIALGTLIGAVTLTGSVVAFAKLQELMRGNAIVFPGQQVINAGLALVIFGLCALVVAFPQQIVWLWLLMFASFALGVLLVIPIGGADMPVVISLLNSYSGLAACATGFVISNQGLVISGSLVGASGLILTQIMCRAMNRSLGNVIFGGFGAEVTAQGAGATSRGAVKSGTADDAAAILDAAQSVIIVPGYGLAVAQAQHAVRDLGEQLIARGVEVRYAIHPVAGRMPGHMNVLLAEADVPYELLVEMEEINSSFPRTDVAIVIGANDVTNPAAREDKGSPIYGMPILDVDKARTCMVIKRSMNPGFAGIDNPLYTMGRTMMLFGDAKGMAEAMVKALKEY